MQIAFDDGGFALDDMEKPSLNMNFDSDAWDDTEILQIFDAAVRSHVTKGQPSKGKKSKDQVSGLKKSRLDVVNEQSTGDYSEFAAKQQSVPSSQQYDNGPKPSNSRFVPTNAPFSHPMPPIFNQPPQNQPQHAQAPEQAPPQQPSSQQFGHLAGLSSPEFDSALSDMLMAWYQSGYATGKFYTLLEQQQKTQQQQAEWWQQYNNCYQNQQEGGDGGVYQQQYSGSK